MREGHLAALCSEKSLTPAELERIAEALGRDLDTEYVVAAAAWDHIPALRLALAMAQRGNQAHTHLRADALVVFYPVGLRAGSEAHRLHASLPRLVCGLIGGGCTLGRVPQSATVAASLARLLESTEQGAMTWARGWARIVSPRTGRIATATP